MRTKKSKIVKENPIVKKEYLQESLSEIMAMAKQLAKTKEQEIGIVDLRGRVIKLEGSMRNVVATLDDQQRELKLTQDRVVDKLKAFTFKLKTLIDDLGRS